MEIANERGHCIVYVLGEACHCREEGLFESSLGISIAKLMINVGLHLHNGSYKAEL